MSTTLALLHSPLTSAEAWGELPAALTDLGYRVVVPEVLDDDEPPYAQHYVARAALQLNVESPDERVVLVGHSGSGPLLPQLGFARKAAGVPVCGYVFLDAMLPRVPNATTRLEIMATEDRAETARLTRQLAAGHRFPDWTEADLAAILPDPQHRAVLLAGLRPRTLDFFTEPLPVPEDWPDARCGYLQLSDAYAVPAKTASNRGWSVGRLASHHFAAMNQPGRVAEQLHALLLAL